MRKECPKLIQKFLDIAVKRKYDYEWIITDWWQIDDKYLNICKFYDGNIMNPLCCINPTDYEYCPREIVIPSNIEYKDIPTYFFKKYKGTYIYDSLETNPQIKVPDEIELAILNLSL